MSPAQEPGSRASMRLLIVGYGKMGQLVEQLAVERGDEVIGRIDVGTDEWPSHADVAIDFSTAEALSSNCPKYLEHRLPVVMICGNNGAWGLEKHPMQALYGYDVAADLQPGCRYDEVVRALGGAGELVTAAAAIGPALRRAFASGVPYLVNVVTDPEVVYPRSTTGV